MDISKLDEAQGLDEAMLKRWLINTGWSHYPGELIWLHKPTYATLNLKKGLAVQAAVRAQAASEPKNFLTREAPIERATECAILRRWKVAG